jgi:hypothetical protein
MDETSRSNPGFLSMEDESEDGDWAEYWNRRLLAIGPSGFSEINQRLQAESIERGLWWEIRRGYKDVIPLMCRPLLMDLSCRGYVHHVTWQIRMGLRRVINLMARHPEASELVPFPPEEEEWLSRYRRPPTPYENPVGPRLFCRLDALVSFDGPGWRDTMKIMETNGIATGGIMYAPAAEELFMEIVAPLIAGDEDELLRHARSLGTNGPPTLALVDDKSLYTFGGEFGRLTAFYEKQGYPTLYVDPQELEVDREGRLHAQGRQIDLCFRFLDLAEFVELEARGHDLTGVRTAFSQNRMVPSVGGDLQHKSVLELFTNPDFAPLFSSEQRRVFLEHVLWTRLLFERRTTLPDGATVDLAEYARTHQSNLVLKPNCGSGGEGVVVGDYVSPSLWQDALEKALAEPKSCVVQWAAAPQLQDFPERVSEELQLGPYHSTAGFFPCRTGLGVFGRYSKHPVVNLQQGGGVVPFLVNVR